MVNDTQSFLSYPKSVLIVLNERTIKKEKKFSFAAA